MRAPPDPPRALTDHAWTHPRFAPYAHLVARIAALPAWPSITLLDDLLADHLRAPDRPAIRLVDQPAAPARRRRAPVAADALYELRIVDRGEVPSRHANLHDLCNALVWAVFPHAKWALSHRLADLQRARATGATRLPGTRTPAHDRLALLDEGGLILAGPRTVVFGHAILEHAARGQLDVRAAPFPLAASSASLAASSASLAAIDAALAAAITSGAEISPGPGIPIDDTILLR